MKVVTGTQMAEIDRKAQQEMNIDSLILMENAGMRICERIFDILKNWNTVGHAPFNNIVVICGKGNNGGDGFVAARHLLRHNINTKIFAVADKSDYSNDALKNYLALENFGDINPITEDTLEDLRDAVLDASIVIDALLGIGFKGNIEGIYAQIIDIINEADGLILAVDIPSGVDANTGYVDTTCVEADYTETFALPKLGLLLYPGADCVGKLHVSGISIPDFLLDNCESKIFVTEENYIFSLMPWRPEDSHKGSYGKVLTIAGSRQMTGAGLLASFSALRIGAGSSILAAPSSIIPYYTGSYPELMFCPLEETREGTIGADAYKDLADTINEYQVVIIGPGMGVSMETIQFTRSILELTKEKLISVVVDADALNCIAEMPNFELYDNAVITPHPKELARLLDVTVEEILNDKLKYIKMAQDKFKCTVVLKGSRTIITYADYIFINSTGNTGLSTAGTGDVLSGVIGGLIAQGSSAFDAAVGGVYLHGLAADIASKDTTEYSLVASDVIDYLPDAIATVVAE